ncbi:MAG: dihydrodipicolinate synthase family protein [Thiolinea sp.]
MRFEGIYTPVITPHNDDGSINETGLESVIEHLIASGVHGLILAGTTGEYYAQSREERLHLMQVFQGIINKRVPLIIGTGAMRTEDSVEYAEAAAKAGADALLVATPPYAVPTERENALHALAIDRAANLPIMLYNYPGRMGVNMGEEYLDRVGRSPNFAAIKESSGDINRLHLLARDYPHIQLGCGMDDQALEFFAWGASCWVCAGSNFAPEAHIALYQACRVEGDFEKGRRIMTAMLPLMRVLEQGGKFVQCIKYGLSVRGIPAGPPRKPLQPLNKNEKRDLEQVIRVMDSTLQHITGSNMTNGDAAGDRKRKQRTYQENDEGPMILAGQEGTNNV